MAGDEAELKKDKSYSARASPYVITRKKHKQYEGCSIPALFFTRGKETQGFILNCPGEFNKYNQMISLAELLRKINLSNRTDLGDQDDQTVLLVMM